MIGDARTADNYVCVQHTFRMAAGFKLDGSREDRTGGKRLVVTEQNAGAQAGHQSCGGLTRTAGSQHGYPPTFKCCHCEAVAVATDEANPWPEDGFASPACRQ